jgi:UDP-glucose 6-dehydrogenase
MTQDRLKTAIVGAGDGEMATAVVLAEQSCDIVLVEQDPARLAALGNGRTPFREPDLPEACATEHAGERIVSRSQIPRDWLDLIVAYVGNPIGDTRYARELTR